MELFVQYKSICVDSYREDVEYGDWSDTNDFYVTGVNQTSRAQWSGLAGREERFNVCFDVEHDDTVYVLWMTYSHGDTFGHSTGNGEILWVFRNLEVAQKALKDIEAQVEHFSLHIRDERGNKIELTNPGSGYFESVESVEITEFKLNP